MTTSERFLEIQELFHAAVKLAPEERRSFLLTRCPNDASLRQEVEMLLAEDVNPSAVLDANPEQSRSFTLPIGTRLGPYELIGTIGAGGMGEVYRARDSNLQRSVAIKILPGSFACDPDRISRFRREAQLLASLNHPNIAAIYGLEESGPVLAIVMELVEGPTLSERIAAGPVPVQEALRIAKQMTEALGAAHERGIVHRDFKPANIKIAREGAVKVLDFGLGKFINTDDAPAQRLHTLYGMVLGTAPYMAPEQARCAAVDERADIWAFGVVLYELLTGERLFAGDTRSDVLAAVLAKEPDWTRIPGALRRLLQRCLQKIPNNGFTTFATSGLWWMMNRRLRRHRKERGFCRPWSA